MAELPVRAGFDLPGGAGPVQTLVAKRLPPRLRAQPAPLADVWPAAHFGLHRATAFTGASAEVQAAVLADCARGTLLEAYFIEKAGVSYAAKMTLLAETIDERSLYALFAAEEAAHLDAIGHALGPVDAASWQADPFLALLGEIIEAGDRVTGQLVIQVVLEGWGLLHYASLRDACQDDALRTLLDRILADEAGHHGAGVHLLRGVALSPDQRRRCVDLLGRMLAMVQLGPALVVGAIERHTGGLTAGQRRRLYAELDAEGHIRSRLRRLRSCLDKTPAAALVTQALEDAGRFTVPALAELP